MIKFFPSAQETRLIPVNQDELIDRFQQYIKPINANDTRVENKEYLFNGLWNDDEFSISLKLKVANNFIPIIHGKYMDSDEGILIQLKYGLFPATRKLLLFWTALTLLITIFFIAIHHAWIYGAISFGFCLVNYILSVENFKNQVRKSKRMLDKMLS